MSLQRKPIPRRSSVDCEIVDAITDPDLDTADPAIREHMEVVLLRLKNEAQV